MRPRESPRLLRRIAGQARSCAWQLAGLFLLGGLAPPLTLLTPLPLALAVDLVIQGRPLPRLLAGLWPGPAPSPDALLGLAVVLVIAVAILAQLRDTADSVLGAYVSERLVRDFRARLFRHVQRLSLSYHDTRGTADSTYRIQYDATSIGGLTVDGLVPLVTSLMTVLSMLYVVVRLDARLALVALAICPPLMAVIHVYRRRLRTQAREIRTLESSALEVVSETLGAARVVKAFGQEKREEARFVRQADLGRRARLRLAMSQGRLGLLVSLITGLGTATVLFFGTREVQRQQLTLGELLLVMGYLTQLYGPLKTVGRKMGSVQRDLAGAERAFALLDEAPDVPERPDARPLGRARGSIEFRDVHFGYGPGTDVLHGLSFSVPAGTCVGLAGATGAGKTTLVSLLTRFYDPTRGAVLLDGVDLRDYRLADLRDQFAIVIQEPILFSTSIAENIAYARPRAGRAEIEAAARAADAHEFITALADGYDTLVGERGMTLSGGERQRISLARAFLKDARVLILDEPTSAVDSRTEAAILRAMERLMPGRTTFIITHRPAMLRHCRVVLWIDRARRATPEPAPRGDRPAARDSAALGSLVP